MVNLDAARDDPNFDANALWRAMMDETIHDLERTTRIVSRSAIREHFFVLFPVVLWPPRLVEARLSRTIANEGERRAIELGFIKTGRSGSHREYLLQHRDYADAQGWLFNLGVNARNVKTVEAAWYVDLEAFHDRFPRTHCPFKTPTQAVRWMDEHHGGDDDDIEPVE